MARAKSEDKRNAILSAAAQVFAERGLGATTSAVSSAAGIAEGTLFTYFNTKDELTNALYCDLKLQLADAMMSHFPRKASVRNRLLHVWKSYVDWGLSNPAEQKALKQLEVWSGLTEQSKAAGFGPFAEIRTMTQAAADQRLFQDVPEQFIAASMSALAEMTMDLVRRDPAREEIYRTSGFNMFWAGIARKP